MRDGWRLALGMLTVVPARMPGRVDGDVARWAMVLAPVAVLPLGLLVLLVGVVGTAAGLPTLVVGLLAVAGLVLGTRAFHVDGLSDTADGLTASHDPERSLAAMHTSTSGPAGGAAVFLVLAVQAVALTPLLTGWPGQVLAGVLVCLSRLSLWITCLRGVPAARDGGLAAPFIGRIAPSVAVGGWLAAAVLVAGLLQWAGGDWWRGVLAVLLAAAVVGALVRRATRRLGGVNGDVFGAAIELCLATLLVGVVAVG